jgi:hypothetical protein
MGEKVLLRVTYGFLYYLCYSGRGRRCNGRWKGAGSRFLVQCKLNFHITFCTGGARPRPYRISPKRFNVFTQRTIRYKPHRSGKGKPRHYETFVTLY